MAKLNGRAPSPYRKSIPRPANQNTPAPRVGKPANSNIRSFSPPKSVIRGVPPQVLRQAVRPVVARRALLFAARMGVRFIPYAGLVLTVVELIGLIAEALRVGGIMHGGKFKGYVLTCKTGPASYLYGGGSPCGSGGYWDWPSMLLSDSTGRANVQLGYPGSFNVWEVVPGQAIGPYELFVAGENWTKSPGAPATPAPTRFPTNVSPETFIDAVRALDPRLGNDIQNALTPAAPPALVPPLVGQPPAAEPTDILRDNPRRVVVISQGKPPVIGKLPGKFPAAKPPPPGVTEGKARTSRTVGAAIFRGLDKISEAAEVVDILFQALPCAIQKAEVAKRQSPYYKTRGLVDQAGQYGIDGADWKTPVILRHYDKIDWRYALEGIARNELEDQIIGRMQAQVKKVYRGPADMVTARAGKTISKTVGIAPRCQ